MTTDITAQRPARKRSSPGRPEGGGNFREEILDAAEAKFADLGFAGASLRDIVEQANVTQALVNYYFGSKHNLFVEVYLRRGLKIAAERMSNLAALQGRQTVSVREILRAFLSPSFEMRRTPGGRAFIRLQARLHTEPAEFAYDLRRRTYDESTRAYADMLARHARHLSTQTIYWRLVQTIGAYLYVISDAHRSEEISMGAAAADDDARIMEQLIAFCAAGFEAPDLSDA